MNFSSLIPDRTIPKGREPSISGDRYGRLVLVSEVEGEAVRQSQQSQRYWNCVCDCGKTSKVKLTDLKTGDSKSCGCLKSGLTVKRKTTHGESGSRTHAIWKQLVQRTTNPNNDSYARYGGRGIDLPTEWLKFENFLRDMGPAPGNLSIDRVNNSLGYSLENCRWATTSQQARNRRSTKWVGYRESNICLAEACEIAGLPYSRVYRRLNRYGWPISQALGPAFSDPILLELPN